MITAKTINAATGINAMWIYFVVTHWIFGYATASWRLIDTSLCF